jgi:hypothetical protein
MKISEDGHLLMKTVPKASIRRTIDWKSLGITEADIKKQSNLSKVERDGIVRKLEEQSDIDRYYIIDMLLPYNPPPDDRDEFVWYNDIGVLSGTAGYLRIRDGYVYGKRVVMMS